MLSEPAEQALTLAVGEERRIALPGRGSSGHGWTVQERGDAGVVAVAHTAGARPALPPAGGLPPPSFSLDEVLVLTGLKVGTVVLEGRLARPSGAAAVDQRRIRVTVVPAPSPERAC